MQILEDYLQDFQAELGKFYQETYKNQNGNLKAAIEKKKFINIGISELKGQLGLPRQDV